MGIQEAACKIFSCKDAKRVNTASDRKGQAFQLFKQGIQKAGTAINGKHPDGSMTRQTQVSFAKAVQGSKNDFKTPSKESAFYKVFGKCFHHIISMVKKNGIIHRKEAASWKIKRT